MNTKLVLTLVLIAAIAFLVVTFLSSPVKDNFVGMYSQAQRGCKEQCIDMHPEAARMDLDADNSIADTVMAECMAECEGLPRKPCASCA